MKYSFSPIMSLYRYPILIIIIVLNLGILPLPSKQNQESILMQSLILQPLEAASNTEKNENYDEYMQDAYSATEKRDYKKAKEYFTKALKERPDDRYAKRAIKNVTLYQERSNSSSSGFLFYIFGGMVVLGAALIAIPFILNRKTAKNESKTMNQSSFSPDPKNNLIDIQGVASTKQEQPLTSLELQQTTRIANIDVVEALIQDLQDVDPKKRRKATWEMAQKGDSRAMKPLVHLMIDADSQERGLILESLSQICLRTLKPMNQALAIALQDENPQVRKNAIRDLTRIYTMMSQVDQMLSIALEDSNPEVQETAKWAFQKLNIQLPARLDLPSRKTNNPAPFEDDNDISMIP